MRVALRGSGPRVHRIKFVSWLPMETLQRAKSLNRAADPCSFPEPYSQGPCSSCIPAEVPEVPNVPKTAPHDLFELFETHWRKLSRSGRAIFWRNHLLESSLGTYPLQHVVEGEFDHQVRT